MGRGERKTSEPQSPKTRKPRVGHARRTSEGRWVLSGLAEPRSRAALAPCHSHARSGVGGTQAVPGTQAVRKLRRGLSHLETASFVHVEAALGAHFTVLRHVHKYGWRIRMHSRRTRPSPTKTGKGKLRLAAQSGVNERCRCTSELLGALGRVEQQRLVGRIIDARPSCSRRLLGRLGWRGSNQEGQPHSSWRTQEGSSRTSTMARPARPAHLSYREAHPPPSVPRPPSRVLARQPRPEPVAQVDRPARDAPEREPEREPARDRRPRETVCRGGMRASQWRAGRRKRRRMRERERRTPPARRAGHSRARDGPRGPLCPQHVALLLCRGRPRERDGRADPGVDRLFEREERAGPEGEAGARAESALDARPEDAVVLGLLVEVPAVCGVGAGGELR